jgi:hypothetical protein
MDLLWMFAALAPIALGLLFAFAARVDPVSGRVRARQTRRTGQAADTPSLLAADHH